MKTLARLLAAVVFGFCLSSVPTKADVLYSFQAYSSFTGETGYFSVAAPDLFTGYAGFSPDQLRSYNVQVNGVDASMLPVSFFPDSNGYDKIAFGSQFFNYYSFPSGSFSAFGSYDTVEWGAGQAGHLEITAVPEPSSAFLAALGAVALAYLRRRR